MVVRGLRESVVWVRFPALRLERAYSKTALRSIRIAEVRVQFPVGPPKISNGASCAGPGSIPGISTIRNFQNFLSQTEAIAVLEKLAKALDVSVDELLK